MKNKKVVIIITVVLAVVFVGAAIFLFNMLGKKNQEKEDNKALVEEVTIKEDNPIDFNKLKAENTDIYSWITIPNTEVNAPVLQKEDTNDKFDNFYLDHLYNKVSGISGAIYTQKINSTDWSDFNTVIYGHNMRNLEAFGCLYHYKEQEYFDNHREIIIYTPDKIYHYQIFAAITFSDKHIMKDYDFTKQSDCEKYINDIQKSAGIVDKSVEVTANDKLITLSTCIAGAPNNRYLVVGKLVSAN